MSADRWVLVRESVVDFLRGAAPMDGLWFGERHPDKRGAFWWREALAAAPAAPEPHIDGWPLYSGLPPAAPAAEPDKAAWWALVMGAAASIEDAANCLRDPDAKRQAEGAAAHYRAAAQKLYAGASPAQSREPLTLTDEQVEAAMNPCDDSDMGRHLRREFIASFKRVYARLHGIGSQP